jgi:serine/threonine protein kinase
MRSRTGNGGPPSGLDSRSPTLASDGRAPACALSLGQFVPEKRIRIIERLTQGAVGELYRAIHLDLERPVALKVLRNAPDSEAIDRFRREAAVTARIDSPYVVDVLDYGTLPDGRPFYVMPWLGSTTLETIVRSGPVPVARAIGLLRMACKGLASAHAIELTHRDVKPQNLMLVDTGSSERLVVVDFGLATWSGSVPELHGGTPTYMAPEQVMGAPIDPRTDVYALGCVAYEMLTGRTPFVAPTVVSLLRQHADCDPTPPHRLCPQRLPEGLETVVLRCLEKAPEDRYASMLELEAALCEVQVATGLRTPWDPLPPPDIDERRRAKIARALYAPMPSPGRRRRVTVVSAVLLLGVAAPLLPAGSSVSAAPHQATATAVPAPAELPALPIDEEVSASNEDDEASPALPMHAEAER